MEDCTRVAVKSLKQNAASVSRAVEQSCNRPARKLDV